MLNVCKEWNKNESSQNVASLNFPKRFCLKSHENDVSVRRCRHSTWPRGGGAENSANDGLIAAILLWDLLADPSWSETSTNNCWAWWPFFLLQEFDFSPGWWQHLHPYWHSPFILVIFIHIHNGEISYYLFRCHSFIKIQLTLIWKRLNSFWCHSLIFILVPIV